MVEFFAGIACGVLIVWMLRALVAPKPPVYIRAEEKKIAPPKSVREYLEEKIK